MYKVFRRNVEMQLASLFARGDDEVIYKENEWSTAPHAERPLLCFDSASHAREFVHETSFQRDQLGIPAKYIFSPDWLFEMAQIFGSYYVEIWEVEVATPQALHACHLASIRTGISLHGSGHKQWSPGTTGYQRVKPTILIDRIEWLSMT